MRRDFRIRGAIPPGSNSPPAEVFGVIETALCAHFAREIEALIDLLHQHGTRRSCVAALACNGRSPIHWGFE
jgi:hypothetical protein